LLQIRYFVLFFFNKEAWNFISASEENP
jgi:hypothetical protein